MGPGPRNGSAGTTAYLLPRFLFPIQLSNSQAFLSFPSPLVGRVDTRSVSGWGVAHKSNPVPPPPTPPHKGEGSRRACAPVFFNGAGYAVVQPAFAGPSLALEQSKEWSAKRRTSLPSCRVLFWRTRAPLGAPRRLFCPRGRNFRARTRAAFGSTRSGRLSPPFVRAASSHRRQSPHSRDGRRPEASRGRGYEPRPQAPHPTPPA